MNIENKDEEIHIKPFVLLKDIDVEAIKEDVNIMNKEFERRYMGNFIIDKNKKYTRIEKGIEKIPYLLKSSIIKFFCPAQIIDTIAKLPNEDSDTIRFDNPDSRFKTGCRGITCEECWDKEL